MFFWKDDKPVYTIIWFTLFFVVRFLIQTSFFSISLFSPHHREQICFKFGPKAKRVVNPCCQKVLCSFGKRSDLQMLLDFDWMQKVWPTQKKDNLLFFFTLNPRYSRDFDSNSSKAVKKIGKAVPTVSLKKLVCLWKQQNIFLRTKTT